MIQLESVEFSIGPNRSESDGGELLNRFRFDYNLMSSYVGGVTDTLVYSLSSPIMLK